MALSQIVILTNTHKSLRHSQIFRISFESDAKLAKDLMVRAAHDIAEITSDPSPNALVIETTESWIVLKIFYSIKDFSLKYTVADRLIETTLLSFRSHQIKLATNRVYLEK